MKRTKYLLLLAAIIFKWTLPAFSQNYYSSRQIELLWELKEQIRNWSCEPFLEGTFTKNIELELNNNKLVIKKNFTQKDAELFGFPEYMKTIIDPLYIKEITVQENDKTKTCAGIIIKTTEGGITHISKYRTKGYEEPMPREREYIEEFGWRSDAIRISKNELFEERSVKVISTLKSIATSFGNTHLIDQSMKNKEKYKTTVSGTGLAISTKGHIITSAHVINGANKIKVKGVNGDYSVSYIAEIVIEDKRNDLAIIKIADTAIKLKTKLPFTISELVSDVGTSVFTLGYPLKSLMGEEIKLTTGIISSRSGFQGDVGSYQISVPLQPGNSGGPLFDYSGRLLGIVNAKLGPGENVSYSIKSPYLISLLHSFGLDSKFQFQNMLIGKSLSDKVKIIKRYIYSIEVSIIQ